MFPSNRTVSSGGFNRRSGGNAGYNRHISHLEPQPSVPEELSIEQLQALTQEQLRRCDSLWAQKGPYVYHQILPALSHEDQEEGNLEATVAPVAQQQHFHQQQQTQQQHIPQEMQQQQMQQQLQQQQHIPQQPAPIASANLPALPPVTPASLPASSQPPPTPSKATAAVTATPVAPTVEPADFPAHVDPSPPSHTTHSAPPVQASPPSPASTSATTAPPTATAAAPTTTITTEPTDNFSFTPPPMTPSRVQMPHSPPPAQAAAVLPSTHTASVLPSTHTAAVLPSSTHTTAATAVATGVAPLPTFDPHSQPQQQDAPTTEQQQPQQQQPAVQQHPAVQQQPITQPYQPQQHPAVQPQPQQHSPVQQPQSSPAFPPHLHIDHSFPPSGSPPSPLSDFNPVSHTGSQANSPHSPSHINPVSHTSPQANSPASPHVYDHPAANSPQDAPPTHIPSPYNNTHSSQEYPASSRVHDPAFAQLQQNLMSASAQSAHSQQQHPMYTQQQHPVYAQQQPIYTQQQSPVYTQSQASSLQQPIPDAAFQSPAQSQEFSPSALRRAASAAQQPPPPWGVGPGMRDPPKVLSHDDIHSGCVHYRNAKGRMSAARRSRTSLSRTSLSSSSGLRASVEHAYPPGTKLADVLAHQHALATQPGQQQLYTSQQRWQQQQQQQRRSYPFLSQQNPLSTAYYYGPSEASERREKQALYADRSGLSRDLKLQRSSTRVLKEEHKRLAEEVAALERSMESMSLGLINPNVVKSRLDQLQSRLNWLAQSTPLINDDALPKRPIQSAGNGEGSPASSQQADLLLNILHLAKQSFDSTAAEADSSSSQPGTPETSISYQSDAHPPSHAQPPSPAQLHKQGPAPAQTQQAMSRPQTSPSRYPASRSARLSPIGADAGKAAVMNVAAASVDADENGLVYVKLPTGMDGLVWGGDGAQAVPAKRHSQQQKQQGLSQPVQLSQGQTQQQGGAAMIDASAQQQQSAPSPSAVESAAPAAGVDKDAAAAAADTEPQGTDKGEHAEEEGDYEENIEEEHQEQVPTDDNTPPAAVDTEAQSAPPVQEAVTPPPEPGSRLMLNPRGRGEVPVVVPVLYSQMGSAERWERAQWQLERPLHVGNAHEVYNAARHPVPHFEHVPARTKIRQTMSPSTPFEQKPEFLRQAEEDEEAAREREEALKQPRFCTMSLEEANEVLDKETAEEEAALRLSGVRTRAMERDARAAWARKQEYQTEAALKQREYRAEKAQQRQEEQDSQAAERAGEIAKRDQETNMQDKEQQPHQVSPDYGTYTAAAAPGSLAASAESLTFVKLASNRTVRDRQLVIEKAALDIKLRNIHDVQPLDWQRTDYEHAQNEKEIDRIIKDDLEEREEAAEQAAAEQEEQAMKDAAIARLRKEAAAQAAQEEGKPEEKPAAADQAEGEEQVTATDTTEADALSPDSILS